MRQTVPAQPGVLLTARRPDHVLDGWRRRTSVGRLGYTPHNDETYAKRFAKLLQLHHPAVASILAHEVTMGTGCYNTRRPR